MKDEQPQIELASANVADDPLWYRDAIVYELHIKAFADSNGDGIGDFPGLTAKLDYIQNLGVNTIWVLPFYPSPQRDDGYDIADYHNINPVYGSRRDFRQFVREAHRRGLRVIIELVINHTSDQHPWFQAARAAPRGSSKRDFYVWSDTDKKFPETRIIFTDTESSNWTWDPVAKQYYWHRFFSHQPDLNFDNPVVEAAITKVMRFWLDQGVDGLRLDAIPYLIEREGTNNENLAETHAVIKRMRAVVDQHYQGRMFLAEANQWPEDVRDYFGEGDECHMAYHFPLMPRMYMAIAQEDRHPIIEIMRQTPDIPANCQWAVFLRNHDELTLEMVTDAERDYMYSTYASDPRMRINFGIRRRLAPLLENNRDKIELINSMLMSMPGSPILYYGDELGMGDNIYLGDRNGVRTPMQWSPDRNAGFSRADPARLFLPPIMDPIYGYLAVNVEAQEKSPSSLLNWMKRLIAARKAHPAFGRGSLEFLHPGNRKILAYLRITDTETLLCVANLARTAQPVELDLARFKGRVPIELMGRTAFPPVGELPYFLTLPGHGFYWFQLSADAPVPSWHDERLTETEAPLIVIYSGWKSFFPDVAPPERVNLARKARAQLEQEAMASFLPAQRWFAAKGETLDSVTLSACARGSHPDDTLFGLWDVALAGCTAQRYFVPLKSRWERAGDTGRPVPANIVARLREKGRTGWLVDAFSDEDFCRGVAAAIGRGERLESSSGVLHFNPSARYAELAGGTDGPDAAGEPLAVHFAGVQGSNTSVILGDRLFLKGYRRISAGVSVELEIGRFLTETAHYRNAVPVAGAIEWGGADGETATLAILQGFVENQGDGWAYTQAYLTRYLEEAPSLESEQGLSIEDHAAYAALVRLLGVRTAELHLAFAQSDGGPAFAPEWADDTEVAEWVGAVREEARQTLAQLRSHRERLSHCAAGPVDELLALEDALLARLDPAGFTGAEAIKTRHHGDYHLGQVLLRENDFLIIDFEGEPARPLAERRLKRSPFRDVAGMRRSFSYAGYAALQEMCAERPVDYARFRPLLEGWERLAVNAFMDGYMAAAGDAPGFGADALMNFTELFSIEKALYEIRYELNNRPDWLNIPVSGLLASIAGPTADATRPEAPAEGDARE